MYEIDGISKVSNQCSDDKPPNNPLFVNINDQIYFGNGSEGFLKGLCDIIIYLFLTHLVCLWNNHSRDLNYVNGNTELKKNSYDFNWKKICII